VPQKGSFALGFSPYLDSCNAKAWVAVQKKLETNRNLTLFDSPQVRIIGEIAGGRSSV
jgi:hypothetical protein